MTTTRTRPQRRVFAKEIAPRIAVLIPCFNEEATIERVVLEMKAALSDAAVYVFDNNSTDATAAIARRAGAQVVPSPRQGKGMVVRHMFRSVDADYYVLIDGDDTYPAEKAPELLAIARSTGADMVVGSRLGQHSDGAFRPWHGFGNRLIAWLISSIFHVRLTDVLSGFRVFSRRFARSVPLMTRGFEIEAELTLQAVSKQMLLVEYPIAYGERPEGSVSKLNTFRDGARILWLVFSIFKDFKPLTFFGGCGILLVALGLIVGAPSVVEYIRTGEIDDLPSIILASAIGILAALSVNMGLVLHTIRKYHDQTFESMRKLADAAECGGHREERF